MRVKYCSTCHAYYGNDVATCPVDDTVLRNASDLAQGIVIGRKYEVLKKIGAGGMATVYLVRHLAFDEIRAIKVVRGWMAEDEDFLRRLRSEAVMLRRLKHPNAVRVDDIDNFEDGRPFIVMEYVDGTDLHCFVRDRGPLSCARVLSIATQVASALAAAHKLGIIHRDIKPDNILLVTQEDGSEFVKVLDFGIAKLKDAPVEDHALTQTGLVLCTPGYASPEQARGLSSDRLDGRSDLYSLGLVMYEMLTGELPFHSDTPMGLLIAQISTPPRPPAELKPELKIPSEMSDLLMKVLEKDPNQRFQSAEEMLEAMARVKVLIDESATDEDVAPEDATTVSDAAMSNIRWRVDRASAAAAPVQQRESPETPPAISERFQPLSAELPKAEAPKPKEAVPPQEAPPNVTPEAQRQLLLDIDEPVSGNRHLWVWALAAMIVLAAVGGFTYSTWHHTTANNYAAASPPSDGDILGKVRDRLAAMNGARSLRASVSRGVVNLSGEVSGKPELENSIKSISEVPGVVQVNESGVRIERVLSPNAPASAMASSPQPPEASRTPKPSAMAAMSGAVLAPSELSEGTVARSLMDGESSRVRELLKKAKLAMDGGQYDLAITNYSDALKIDPQNPEARNGKRKAEHAKKYEEQLDSEQ